MTATALQPTTQPTSPIRAEARSRVRAWIAAARPKTLPAAMAPVVVGSALAWADRLFDALAAGTALAGAVLIQIGTNFANDYFDFRKGADTPDRLGPARATAEGWITPAQMAIGMVVAFGLATAVGAYLVAIGGWPIVIIGLVSIASGVLYTAGPAALAYIGLGDLFVWVFFGPVAVAGTWYVQGHGLAMHAVWAGVMVGALSTAILVVNNLRDRGTDSRVGKRTLAVRFGATAARGEYLLLLAIAYLLPPGLWIGGAVHAGWLLPLVSLPVAIVRVRQVWQCDGRELNPLLGRTAGLALLFALLLAVGANLGPGGGA